MKAKSIVWMLLLTVANGCSATVESNLKQSQQDGEQNLVSALDAWKLGNPKQLQSQDPAIRFVDDDLVSGLSLIEFKVLSISARSPVSLQAKVKLVLKDRRGQTVERTADYQITLKPKISVLRSDS